MIIIITKTLTSINDDEINEINKKWLHNFIHCDHSDNKVYNWNTKPINIKDKKYSDGVDYWAESQCIQMMNKRDCSKYVFDTCETDNRLNKGNIIENSWYQFELESGGHGDSNNNFSDNEYIYLLSNRQYKYQDKCSLYPELFNNCNRK